MNILFLEWNSYGKEDIIETLKNLGHNITTMPLELRDYRLDPKFKFKLKQIFKQNNYDISFTLNYYPVVSDACKICNIKYVSWIYDSPLVTLYSNNVINECNYIFIFDKQLYINLKNSGVNTVYYMPLGVNLNRLDKLKVSNNDIERFNCDVSFVGSIYNEKHNFYDRTYDKLDDYTKGYLEGIINAQMKVYGYNFLEEVLPDNIIKNMQKISYYKESNDGFETLQYVYANYFLCRKIAELERKTILQTISSKYNLNLYTFFPTPELKDVHNKGQVNYFTEMPNVFRLSKINLNITLRSIKSGIPLRALDIMGAGGFLLTNYQNDFLDDFVPDKDFVFYESIEDLMQKVDYYLKNDEERKTIAKNGYNKVKNLYTYEKRLSEILDIVNN